MIDPTTEAFFEAKYQGSADPWNFECDEYEQSRYDAILLALDKPRYALAYEPGCSIGLLTVRLASRCARVEACDLSATAAIHAAARCSQFPHVSVQHAGLNAYLPLGIDLCVFSEIGYYFPTRSLKKHMTHIVTALQPSGTLLACHWLGNSSDHLLSGDAVHEVIGATPGLVSEYSERHPGYRLDRWRKAHPGK